MNNNLNAFLRVIREGESSQDDYAYRMLFGGSLLDSFASHPNRVITIDGLSSTAAGAYQFLYRTWKEVARSLGLQDFGPASQDSAAIYLIKRRGAYEDVLAGRFETAIRKCNKEWASLPGSPYGQRTLTMDRCKAVYEEYGGNYGLQEEGTETSAQEVKENTMNPLFISAALDAISAVIPAIKDVKNQKAAETVVSVAKEALGARNEQEVVDSMKDPVAANAVKTALEARWYDIQESGGGGITGARKAAMELSERPEGMLRNPAFIVSMLLLPLVYITMGAVYWGADMPQDLKIMTVTAIISGVLNGIMGFWLGTSMSSSKKTDLLAKR
jgi:muramidase (phage lysozyme)